ncbi:uncharacterized protein LOC133206422 [Saccostrea echinata]|uniref:uncharacterized protein LOC133206422 n=1 Tax=Saccostrea echinata TaxID=191078 RepID=UPI002A827194|nr:uncharacterized protein LOC133206422 [Saccostrea echinata]
MVNTLYVVQTVLLILAISDLCWTRYLLLNEDKDDFLPQMEVEPNIENDEDLWLPLDAVQNEIPNSQFQTRHRKISLANIFPEVDGLSAPVSKRKALPCFFSIVACYG